MKAIEKIAENTKNFKNFVAAACLCRTYTVIQLIILLNIVTLSIIF